MILLVVVIVIVFAVLCLIVVFVVLLLILVLVLVLVIVLIIVIVAHSNSLPSMLLLLTFFRSIIQFFAKSILPHCNNKNIGRFSLQKPLLDLNFPQKNVIINK